MQKLENRLALKFTLIAKKKYGSYEALIRRHLWNILTITIENKIWVRVIQKIEGVNHRRT